MIDNVAKNLAITLVGAIAFNFISSLMLGYGLQKLFGSIEVL